MSHECDVAKYFTSLNNFHVAHKYTKNISWHDMEYVIRFLLAHMSMLAYTCLLARVVDKNFRKFMTNKKHKAIQKQKTHSSFHQSPSTTEPLLFSTFGK
jgi:hypothetical protein